MVLDLCYCTAPPLDPTTFASSRHPASSTPLVCSIPSVREAWARPLPSQESPCRNGHSCASPQCFLGSTVRWRCSCCPQLLSRRRHLLRDPNQPASPCGTVCSGCPARKPGLFLPIILILSWGVIGIELSVWKLLLRTQRTGESSEAELWEDSRRRPLGRAALVSRSDGMASRWRFPAEEISWFFSSYRPCERCHFLPSLHSLINTWVDSSVDSFQGQSTGHLLVLAPVGALVCESQCLP